MDYDMKTSRRNLIRSLPACAASAGTVYGQQPGPDGKLPLADFEPKSMLVVPEHKVAKAK